MDPIFCQTEIVHDEAIYNNWHVLHPDTGTYGLYLVSLHFSLFLQRFLRWPDILPQIGSLAISPPFDLVHFF